MSTLRKYESAGGVVPIHWHRGAPPSSEVFGNIVAEVWRMRWSHSVGEWVLEARMVALTATRATSDDLSNWVGWDARTLAANEQVRRWMRPQSVARYRTLTLEDWNV